MTSAFANLHRNLIDGAWVETDTRFEVEDKFSGEIVAQVCQATPALISKAVASAKAALAQGVPAPHLRAAVLAKAADLIEGYTERFIQAMMAEAGFNRTDAALECARAKLTLDLSAEAAKQLTGHTVPFGAHPGAEARIGFTLRDPIGVVAAITPFNSPLNTVIHKVGPSFAAGNPTVLKPSSVTPLCAALLGELLLEAGMPKGFLQIVQGEGAIANHLLENQDIAFYTFTGSTRVGRIIQSHLGLRRSQMELGSIASTILCADADLDAALPKIANAGFRKAGQVCTSVQRLYVERSIFEAAVAGLVRAAATLPAGDPAREETRVGPLISLPAAERVEAWIKEAVARGATVQCGGTREGRVVAPTVLTGVPSDAKAWCEEVFGPIISVQPFDDLDEAIAGANDTEFGLAAGIFTRDIGKAQKAMRQLKFGTVQINETSSARADVMPFGGVKASGFGKEGPLYAAQEMSIERLIVLNP